MLSNDFEKNLLSYTVAHSFHEDQRDYIGLSGIGNCDRVIYDGYKNGNHVGDFKKLLHRMAYELEASLIYRISELGIYEPGKEISLYGGLVQGHTDGFVNGDLLEIKTIEREEWIPVPGRLPNKVFYQVQAYLHYLTIDRVHVVYLARDTGAVRVIGISYKPMFGKRIEEKLDRIVAAVRNNICPACTCGKCGELNSKVLVA